MRRNSGQECGNSSGRRGRGFEVVSLVSEEQDADGVEKKRTV
jgi:hypothetical protein